MRKIYIVLIGLFLSLGSFAQVEIAFVCPTDLVTSAPSNPLDSITIEAIKAAKGGDHFNITVVSNTDVETEVETLNAADVVYVARGCNSSTIKDEPYLSVYRALTAPVIQTSVWAARGDRLGYVSATSSEHFVSDPAVVLTAMVQDANSPVFEGVTETSFQLNDGLYDVFGAETGDAIGNVLLKSDDDRVLLSVIDAGTTLATGDSPAGPRAYMGIGQDDTEPKSYWNYSETGQTVFFNLIDYMASMKTSTFAPQTIENLSVVSNNGQVEVSMKNLETVEIYTISGKLMLTSKAATINANLNKGIYLAKGIASNGKVAVSKFVVR